MKDQDFKSIPDHSLEVLLGFFLILLPPPKHSASGTVIGVPMEAQQCSILEVSEVCSWTWWASTVSADQSTAKMAVFKWAAPELTELFNNGCSVPQKMWKMFPRNFWRKKETVGHFRRAIVVALFSSKTSVWPGNAHLLYSHIKFQHIGSLSSCNVSTGFQGAAPCSFHHSFNKSKAETSAKPGDWNWKQLLFLSTPWQTTAIRQFESYCPRVNQSANDIIKDLANHYEAYLGLKHVGLTWQLKFQGLNASHYQKPFSLAQFEKRCG